VSLPRPIRIWTERPIREADPTTMLRVEGHPEIGTLRVPASELDGWDSHLLILEGFQVKVPAEGAPWWHFEAESGPLTIELRSAIARRSHSPVWPRALWAPGQETEASIVITGTRWTTKDLKAAGTALRRLQGRISRGGRLADWPDETVFREKVEPVVRALQATCGKATRNEAAEKLGISSDWLKDLTHDLTGLDWPAFVKTVD